ncbi:MAG: type II toxin-antitoxin system RelE/ParE family toxin [Verrucomicrobia bacterium]|nr:MAG: type II toxin-antitoxin system RelE/ParE family toxin [Verrucomicrobiota bacterium]
MGDYAVTFARSARRELVRLDAALIARILRRIERLAVEPGPRGARKLKGAHDLWRVRVGDYRFVYSVNDRRRIVDLVRIRHRREVYE